MLYGLEAVILRPPFAAFVSVLLLLGVDRLGLLVASWFSLRRTPAPSWHRWQAPVIGAMALSTILYPLALLGATPRWSLQLIAAILAFGGGIHLLIVLMRPPRLWPSDPNRAMLSVAQLWNWRFLFWSLLFGLGLLALGPITNADSLDYHIGVPISLLNQGGMPFIPEWFHSRLAGNGEILIALGLAIGAEQFESLLQFSGILAVAGILVYSDGHSTTESEGSNKSATDQSMMLAVVALSAPVLLFLVSSPKPQMLPIAMTTLALALATYPSRQRLDRRDALLGFALLCLLVMTASQAKMNFLLSAGIVGLVGLYSMARQRLSLQAIGIGLLAVLVVMVPPLLWKHFQYGGTMLDALLTPFPGDWPGTAAFETRLRAYGNRLIPFPISLVLPSSVGTMTTVLGPGLVIFLWLRPGRDRWIWITIGAAAAVAIIGSILGQLSARFYLEPYFWLLMAMTMMPVIGKANLLWQATRWVVSAQAILILGLIVFGILTLLPGAIQPGLAFQCDGAQRLWLHRHGMGG